MNRAISPLTWAIILAALLITPCITTHEPPSRFWFGGLWIACHRIDIRIRALYYTSGVMRLGFRRSAGVQGMLLLRITWIRPPLSNSWVIFIIWIYGALNSSPNTDCYCMGAVPNVLP